MKKTKAITPASSLVDVSPQEMRTRSHPFETNAQVKSRHEAGEKAQRKLVSAEGRLRELNEIERQKPQSPGHFFITAASVIKERPKAESDYRKARAEAERYSPYSGGSPWSSTSPNNASKKPK